MNKLYKHADLPTQHLNIEGTQHHIPVKARDAAEIARRRAEPAGTLIRRSQAIGAEVVAQAFEQITDEDDLRFTTRYIGSATLNSSWYSFAEGASEVMRRRLFLPLLADEFGGWLPEQSDIYDDTKARLGHVATLALGVETAHRNRYPQTQYDRINTSFGRYCGNTALQLACLPNFEQLVETATPEMIQHRVRLRAQHLLRVSRELFQEIGSHPSLAQFGEPDSDLLVHIRKTAPSTVYRAFTN